MPKLIVVHGGEERVVDLQPGMNVVGRGSKCQVSINDPTMSREHCHVIANGNDCEVIDLGSRNGTLVNGHRVTRRKLEPGDQIRIGDSVIHYEVKKTTQRFESRAPSVSSARFIVKDFSLWTPGPLARAYAIFRATAIATLSLAGLAAAGIVGYLIVRQMSTPHPLDDNLIQVNPKFDPGTDISAAWKPSDDSRMSLDKSVGHSGAGCMAVEKSTRDLLLELAYQSSFRLESGKAVDLVFWTKFDGFRGLVSAKISWLAKGGHVLLEEFASPRKDCSDWTRVAAQFAPPQGAKQFRLALMLLGKGGRVYVDDIELTNKMPATSAVAPRLGDYTFLLTRQGAFCCILWKGIEVVTNTHLYLNSFKEGRIPSTFADPVTPEIVSNRISITRGKLISPVGLREAEYSQQIGYENGELTVAYDVRSSEVKLIDEVEILTTLPNAQALDVPKDEFVRRVQFRIDQHDFVIEYPDGVKVDVENAPGGKRLRQKFQVDAPRDQFVCGFKLREMATTTQYVIEKLKKELVAAEERKPPDVGAQRQICRELMKEVSDAAEQRRYQERIESIQRTEEGEWQALLFLAWKAFVSQRKDLASAALGQMDRFLERFPDSELPSKGEDPRKRLQAILATSAGDATYPRRLVEQARTYHVNGRDAMARALLEVVVQNFAGTDAEKEARQLLSEIGGR